MIKFCIFDLDGTLLNTLSNIADNLNATLSEMGYATFSLARYRYFVGNGARLLVQSALEAQDAYTPARASDVYDKFIVRYQGSPDSGTTVYEGIKETLAALKAQGVLCAVCTNKPQLAAEKSIADFFEKDAFCAVLGAEDGRPLKPAPDGVLSLLTRFGIPAAQTAFIGDSDVDMKTATAAGVRALGATWGFRTPEELTAAGADALLCAPLDLFSHLT